MEYSVQLWIMPHLLTSIQGRNQKQAQMPLHICTIIFKFSNLECNTFQMSTNVFAQRNKDRMWNEI